MGVLLGLTLANSCMLVAVLYLMLVDGPQRPGAAPERTENGYLASAREALTEAMERARPRRTIVVDDWHQVRAEKKAHQDGATLRAPPRYR